MAENIESEIKRALTSVGNLAALKEERRQALLGSRGTLSQHPALRASHRAVHGVVSSFLTKAVSDLDAVDRAFSQHSDALRRAADDELAAAIKRSPGTKAKLLTELERRSKALDAIVAADPTVANPERVLLNRPFLIWPTQGVFFDSSKVEPSNSSAKFKVDSSASNGFEEMSFYFLWDNPKDTVAVININAYLVLHGTCRVGSDGGVLPGIISGDRYSQLWLTANLYPLEWWNQPPTQPLHQTDQSQQALFLHTNTGGWGSVGAIELQTVFRGYDLSHTLMLVPPHGVVVFEVAASVSFSNADGAIAVDFASGDFEVICPAVLVTVLS